MEKSRSRSQQSRWVLGVVAILALVIWPIPLPIPLSADQSTVETPLTWDEIVPSQSLEYHDCGDEFQCARLEVPMDYTRTDGKGRTFALALVRLPAKVPVTDPRYGGAVLINPGKSNETRGVHLCAILTTSHPRWSGRSGHNASLRIGSQSAVDR